MTDIKKIRQEIINNINNIKNKDIDISKIEEELDILENTNGINNVNNLESFYKIYINNKEKVGNKNIINSWIAYALNMTIKKPEGDFLPERRAFARVGFPDIDTDFDDKFRSKIFAYIIEKYGRENVGNVGTHCFLTFKSCLRRVGKALDVADAFDKGKDAFVTENQDKVSEIIDTFPKGSVIKIRDCNGEMQVIDDVEKACKYCEEFKYYMDKYPNIKKHMKVIQGTFSNTSSHASGMCISDIPLERIAPLTRARKNEYATQYPNEDLEAIGLIKFDILALSTLTVIKKTLRLIKENYDINIDIKKIPLDDKSTLKMYREGNLAGVFQCEQYGMQNTMRDIGVDRFEDVMAAVALYRPGPMDNIPSYCERKKGIQEIDYFHHTIEPFVKPYLEKTYGIMIYQESLMQICNSLAGFSITDGYVMIKAIGKKKKYLMDKFEEQFIQGCVNNKVPQDVAQQYWDKFIVPFANYGFNAAHACAYALVSWQSCYLKANYTDEYITCLLNAESERANYEKIEEFEKNFRKNLDIKFLSRTLNDCDYVYKIEKKKDVSKGIYKTEIRPSLVCKSVGMNAAKNIAANSPYKDLRDLAERTDFSTVTTETIGGLIDAGFFKGKKGIDKKEDYIKQFSEIRNDLKMAAKKGVDSVDLFE